MYYLGNMLYIDPYLIWIQQYRATSDHHHQDAGAAASGRNSNNYIATNFLIPTHGQQHSSTIIMW
jgi:hypothetical protein